MDILKVADWLDSEQPRPIDTVAGRLARRIDDEAVWQLGNTAGVVTLLADDAAEYTLGELVGRVTMFGVLLDLWPHEQGECPLALAFVSASRGYERIIAESSCPDGDAPRCSELPTAPLPFRCFRRAVPGGRGVVAIQCSTKVQPLSVRVWTVTA